MRKGEKADRPIMVLAGRGGSIELWPHKLTLRHKGMLGRMTKGLVGDKDIYLTNVSGVQLKRPTWVTTGYFQVLFSGSQDKKSGLFGATEDENTIMFSGRKNYKIAQEMKRRIEELGMRPVAATTHGSVADELAKLADLRDRGVMTTEQFERQREALLGR